MLSRRANGTTMTMMLMGHMWGNTARARGPAKEQEYVHGVGTARQHAKQRAHEDTGTGQRNKDVRRRLSRHDTSIMGESVG